MLEAISIQINYFNSGDLIHLYDKNITPESLWIPACRGELRDSSKLYKEVLKREFEMIGLSGNIDEDCCFEIYLSEELHKEIRELKQNRE